MLELREVTKTIGASTYIHTTSLSLRPGGFNVLLGATNAGKSSLIRIMAGLEKPTTGQVLMDGVDVTDVSTQKRNISLVHQFFVNYPHMSVYENIASPLRVAGVAKSEIEDRVHTAAKLLRLEPMLGRKPQELSGGQQQRCALARAIAKESKAVFLDEPLANLDYKLREELRDQLPDLFSGRGAVVVYATSEPGEALMLGGQTALVHEGRVTQFGPTSTVFSRPDDLVSAEVFSDPPINVAGVTKSGPVFKLNEQTSWTAEGEAASLGDGEYTMAVRPHHVSPLEGTHSSISIKGIVQITELSGSESVAHFAVGPRTWVSLASGVHPYRVGDEHTFYLDTGACFYFGPDGKLAARGGANG